MTEHIEHAMEVMVVVVVRRGSLVGGLFAVIEVELALPKGLSRIWHVSGTAKRAMTNHGAPAQRLRGL
jgi:hypothetical protein